MHQIDGNATCSSNRTMFWECGRHLQKPLPQDKICAKWRPQRITAPAGSRDFAAPLAHQCVVHYGYDGFLAWQMLKHCASHGFKQCLLVEPFTLKQAIGCRPVLKLLRTCTQHPRNSLASQPNQRTDCQPASTLVCALLAECMPGHRKESVEGIDHLCRFFFIADGST